MGNRMISYGYGMEQGKLRIIEQEAEVVRRIFRDYNAGKAFREIADALVKEKVCFFDNICNWNKNTVARILGNSKYIGSCDYPEIVSYDEFSRALNRRAGKIFQKYEYPKEIDSIRKKAVCGQCGASLSRRSMWATREKWFCPNGCKCKKYISDKEMIGGILRIVNGVSENASMLCENIEKFTYQRTPEIMRYTNEIGRLMEERQPSFNAGKKLILTCAAKKFQSCGDNQTATTDYVLEHIRKVAEDNALSNHFIEEFISKVTVEKDGSLTVRFINGAELSDKVKEEVVANADTSTKSSNEN